MRERVQLEEGRGRGRRLRQKERKGTYDGTSVHWNKAPCKRATRPLLAPRVRVPEPAKPITLPVLSP